MTIDLHHILAMNDETVFIVKEKTGITYNVQCGGMACDHKSCEGYIMLLGDFMKDFDDCAAGCSAIGYDLATTLRAAQSLSDAIGKIGRVRRYKFYFDHERQSELKEGWWPVFATAKDVVLEGYIHTGNCD